MSAPNQGGRDGWLWAILALGLGVRLIGVDQPLIDHQAWRQADTAAIARNFYEEGYELFYPRVDWRGQTPGYVETNFPLYPFMVAGAYGLAGGVREWMGRLLSALFSTAAAGLLYGFAWRLYRNPWTARLSALLFLIFPLSVFFGRAFMPEALMLLLSVAALLSFDRWAEMEDWPGFILAVSLAALCFLVKIPTLYLGFPLVALAWSRWGRAFWRRPILWAYLALVLLPPLAWYWHAHRLFAHTGLTFGIWNRYGYDKWAHDLLLDGTFYAVVLARFWNSVFTPVGSVMVILGLFLRQGGRREWVVYAWIGALLLYVLLIPEGNHRLHYYQLPFALPGALLAAKALVWIAGQRNRSAHGARLWRAGLAALLLLGAGAYGTWAILPYYRPPNNVYNYYRSCLAAGEILDRKMPPGVLLVVGDLDENAGTPYRAQSPTLLYYCHRKGWQITPDEFSGERLDSLAALGADYFVSAGGFLIQNRVFWADLVRRGITIPAEYPRFWTDVRLFDRARRARSGPDRDFIVARLGPGESAEDLR